MTSNADMGSLATSSRGDATQVVPRLRSARDERLDFFRGLALLFIFVDHIPGNVAAMFTLHAVGLSDAAEVFVLIAGYAACLAYGPALERGFFNGARQIGRRIRDLYAAHLLLVGICAAILAIAATTFENPLYYEHVNLTPFAYDPWGAIWRTLFLYHQLGYLNILPLYIVLLAAFGGLWWLMQRSVVLALALSVSLWLAASMLRLNLPSWPEINGWFFNPFAWQILFTIGAAAAVLARRGVTLPRAPWLTGLAAAYVVFGFLVAAPWVNVPGWHGTRLIPLEWLGSLSKTNLSPWRLAHILALAYLVAVLMPPTAALLKSRWAAPILNCGRHSLDIFCLGTVLSFLGFVALLDGGRTWDYQLAVNGIGLSLLLGTGWWLARRKARAAMRPVPVAGTAPEGASLRPDRGSEGLVQRG